MDPWEQNVLPKLDLLCREVDCSLLLDHLHCLSHPVTKQLLMLAGHGCGGNGAGVRETVATLRRHAHPARTYRHFLHALHASHPALARDIHPADPAATTMQEDNSEGGGVFNSFMSNGVTSPPSSEPTSGASSQQSPQQAQGPQSPQGGQSPLPPGLHLPGLSSNGSAAVYNNCSITNITGSSFIQIGNQNTVNVTTTTTTTQRAAAAAARGGGDSVDGDGGESSVEYDIRRGDGGESSMESLPQQDGSVRPKYFPMNEEEDEMSDEDYNPPQHTYQQQQHMQQQHMQQQHMPQQQSHMQQQQLHMQQQQQQQQQQHHPHQQFMQQQQQQQQLQGASNWPCYDSQQPSSFFTGDPRGHSTDEDQLKLSAAMANMDMSDPPPPSLPPPHGLPHALSHAPPPSLPPPTDAFAVQSPKAVDDYAPSSSLNLVSMRHMYETVSEEVPCDTDSEGSEVELPFDLDNINDFDD